MSLPGNRFSRRQGCAFVHGGDERLGICHSARSEESLQGVYCEHRLSDG